MWAIMPMFLVLSRFTVCNTEAVVENPRKHVGNNLTDPADIRPKLIGHVGVTRLDSEAIGRIPGLEMVVK